MEQQLSKHLYQVLDFTRAFKHEVNDNPKPQIGAVVEEQRITVMAEEILEFAAAHDKEVAKAALANIKNLIEKFEAMLENGQVENSIEDKLDALIDLQYYLDGTIIAHGLHNVFQKAFTEVHEANISKLVPNMEQAIDSQEKILNEKGADTYLEQTTYKGQEYFIIKVKEASNGIPAGKIMKPINWKAPFLRKFVKEQSFEHTNTRNTPRNIKR